MCESNKIQVLLQALLQSLTYQFPVAGKLDITCEKGVYIINDPNLEVAHIGSTPRGQRGLCQRLNDHISGSSSFAKKYLVPNNLSVRNGFSYKFLEVPSARERALLEALACGTLCPKHIGTGEALE
jgi:hypothetical protein